MENPNWPATSLITITPSDSTVFAQGMRQIYVGATGDVVVETDAGQTVTFKAVPTGATIGPFFVKKVKAASTATLMVGFI